MAVHAHRTLEHATVEADRRDALDRVLAGARHGAADAAEALATVERIGAGDADAWVDEWVATAGLAWTAAGEALDAERIVSARRHLLRAATYYAAALEEVPESAEPGRAPALRQRQHACFAGAIALLPVPAEPVALPYEGTTLPGWFFRAPDAGRGERRPLVVIDHGGDGPTSRALVLGGAAAAERGYHWLAFDGPGQHAALHDLRLRSRPDWEAVLAPLADAMAARADVDAARMAVVGLGRGGYGVLRALTREQRFAAAVVEPPVADLAPAWLRLLPAQARAHAERGDAAALERELRLVELLSPALTARLRERGLPFDRDGTWGGLLRSLAGHRLGDDEAARIRTPLLLVEHAGERRWPGQTAAVAAQLRAPFEIVRVSPSSGPAGSTGDDALAPSLRDARLLDWLDRRLRPAGDRW